MACDSRESVVLRTRKGARALSLLRVVISGTASRQNLLMEQLDDIELAVETLLAEEPQTGGDLVLEVWSTGNGLALSLGGLVNSGVKAALLAPGSFTPSERCLLDVRMLIEPLVDRYSVSEGPQGTFSVEMEKRA